MKNVINKITLIFLLICLIVFCSGCGYNEISKKLVADALVISDNKLNVVVDSGKEPKLYDVCFDNLENSVEELKNKYDYKPFFSHSKAIIVSTEVTIKELSDIIQEFKDYYQISPDTKILLADDNAIKNILKGDFTSKEIYTIIKNKKLCDDRICNYDTILTGKDFDVMFEKDGEIEVRKITI